MERFENQRWSSQEVARLISLFESERRFHDEVVTTLPFPLAIVAADGIIVSANARFMRHFGVKRDDLERKSLTFALPNAVWSDVLRPHEATQLETPAATVTFTPIPRWDRGETEWTAVFLEKPPRTPEPPPASTVDAELAATTAAIESAQRLAGRVTHETNNLIMIAAGYGREILAQLPADSPLREDVSALLDATERIESMAAQLSEFSRSGRRDIATHRLRDLLPASGFRLPADPGDSPVQADRGALLEAWEAFRAAAGGEMRIESAVSAGEVVLTVTGFGKSAESLRQDFEVLNKARDLALAGPKLLQAGARWRVTEAGAVELRLRTGGAPAAPLKRSALVVDDQAGIRTIVRRTLESQGLQVVEAGSGEEALSLLDRRKEEFALLVTDMRMPGMTGRDLADRVRYRHPATRILFVSGFTDDPSVQSGILPERSRFLAKPFDPDRLIDAVKKLLE